MAQKIKGPETKSIKALIKESMLQFGKIKFQLHRRSFGQFLGAVRQ
jgi:hypothetical protein